MLDTRIRMYGTAWCGDCFRARRFLDSRDIPYDYIDINSDSEGAQVVEQHNRGNRSVPTIIFPDGSVLVEPSNAALEQKLALT